MAQILDFSAAPAHPIERLMWLSGVMAEAKEELNAEYQRTYFEARSQGMMPVAVDLKIHSRKTAYAMTRHENDARGRVVRRWEDAG
jgi:hypothetical protein